MTKIAPATICDVTIDFVEPGNRSHPADCFRVAKGDGDSWVCTMAEARRFMAELDTLIWIAQKRLNLERLDITHPLI